MVTRNPEVNSETNYEENRFFIPDFAVQVPNWYLSSPAETGSVVPSQLPQVIVEGLGTFALLRGSLVQWEKSNANPHRLTSKFAEAEMARITERYAKEGKELPKEIVISRLAFQQRQQVKKK